MSESLEYVVKLRGGPEAASDVRRVESAVKSTGGSFKTLGKDSEQAGSKLSKATGGVKSFGKSLIAAGGAFVAWEAGKKAFDFTEELVKSTKQLENVGGLGTAEASRWAGVVAAVGGNAQQSSMAFQKVANASEKQILATKKQIAAGKLANSTMIAGSEPLERLGISTSFLEKHQKNLAPVMELVVDRIHKGGDVLKNSSVLTNLFGRNWKQLSPLLLEGKEHLDGLLSTAKEMGVELKGNAGQALEQLREKQIRATLATEALRLRFTEIAAKPMGDLLQGFSDLTLAIEKNEWGKFNSQAVKIGNTFTKIAETILPHVAESFGHIAPAVLKGFVNGFNHASLGGKAVIAAVLIKKMGLTSAIFSGNGKMVGTAWSKAFIAGAVALGVWELIHTEEGEEATHDIFGGYTKREKREKHETEVADKAAEKKGRSELAAAERKQPKASSRIKNPTLRRGVEEYEEGVHGATHAIGGLGKRIARGIEGHDDVAKVKDVHLHIDGRKVATVNARQQQLSQAAGE